MQQMRAVVFLFATFFLAACPWPLVVPIVVVEPQVGVQVIDEATTGLQFVAATAPAVSAADRANIYYDATTDQLMASVNGGAYTPFLSSTQMVIADGTVTNPGLVFNGEPNPSATGLYLSGNDTLGVTTGGANRLDVTSSGLISTSGDSA